MKTRHGLSFVISTLAVLSTLAPSAAQAEGDKDVRAECVSAFETSQELRASGDLLTARTRLISCIRPECPNSVRTECTKWLEQVEHEIPTVVFEVKVDGEDRTDVKVELDGKLIQETQDGKAVQVNPGSHLFRFSVAPFDPIDKRVIVSEGDKLRAISADFTSPKKAEAPAPIVAPPASKPTHRPVPVPVYVLGGVAVLGGASFAYFGSKGTSKQDDLQSSCAPSCPSTDVDKVKKSYLLADISLGVGVAALLTGAVLYLTRSEAPVEDSAQVSVAPTAGGVSASAHFRF